MIKLKRLGHVLLVVRDIERSKKFYTGLLGFRILEEDPDHGGAFLAIADQSHTIDLLQSTDPNASHQPKGRPPTGPTGLGAQHIAFPIGSQDELKNAYFTLLDNGVQILAAMDHVNQQSIYFYDPDENVLEIYYERPDALAIFAAGRGDGDRPITFQR